METGQAPLIQITLLGTFQVRWGQQVLQAEDWPRRKAAALLKRLALERRLGKDAAVDFLWPEASPDSASNNLYKTIHILRQNLDTGLGAGAARHVFEFEDGILALARQVWVDVHEFERLVSSSAGEPASQANAVMQALALYQGDLLPDDLYAEWTQLPRQSLINSHRKARLVLAGFHQQAGDLQDGIEVLLPLLAHDPADEPVHRELMRLFALSGQRTAALRQFQACKEALEEHLAVQPEPETQALYQQILQGQLGLTRLHPTGSSTPAPPTPVSQLSLGRSSLPSAPPPQDPPRPFFVGRQRELGLLDEHLQAALAGDGRVVFITGEAGQGKTSLLAEFAARSQAAHPTLVTAAGACHALSGAADPYLPFRALIASLSGDWQRPWLRGEIPGQVVRRLQAAAPRTAQILAAHAPHLLDIFLPAAIHSPGQMLPNAPLDQRQVFEEVRQLLHVLSLDQPVLLLLDDLQWIDRASASLLFYLGRLLANSAVLVVGAYRPGEVHAFPGTEGDTGGGPPHPHPLAAVVQELVRYRGEIHIDLDAAGAVEGRSFVDAFLDSEPNRLDATFREALYRRTRGHPLFTVELLRALQDQGDLTQDVNGMWTAGPSLEWEILPARVEAVVARRIEHLPGELRQLLSAASVEGETFTVEVVSRALDKDLLPVLTGLAGELGRRYNLVREQGELHLGGHTLTRYQFQHNLFQGYLYQRLSNAERRFYHKQVAAALEALSGEEIASQAGILSHHYLQAGDQKQAVKFLCIAGDEARWRTALEEAVQFYEAALENWGADDPAGRAAVLQKLGEALLALGRAEHALDRLSQAAQENRSVGSRSGLGAVLRLMGRSFWEQGDRARALEHYHQALAELQDSPAGMEAARAISAISQMHMLADEYDQSLQWGERALRLAGELQAEDIVVHAKTNLGVSLVATGEVERGLALQWESLEQAEALRLPHDICRAYTGLGDSLVNAERYAEAYQVYERMLEYTRQVRAEMFEGVALVQLGYLEWWSGKWEAALARREGLHAWMESSTGNVISKVWAGNLLAEIYNDLGLPVEARAALAPYTEIARRAQEQQTTLPHLYQLARSATDPDERSRLVLEMLALLDTPSYPRYEILPPLRLVGTWTAENDPDNATALNRLEAARAIIHSRASAASQAEVRAFAASLHREWAAAQSEYQAAAQEWEALGRPYDRLRALAGWLQALAWSGDVGPLPAVSRAAAALVDSLAAALPDPKLQAAFLASPLVLQVQKPASEII